MRWGGGGGGGELEPISAYIGQDAGIDPGHVANGQF